MHSAEGSLSSRGVQVQKLHSPFPAPSSLPCALSRLIMSPWNSVASLSCNHSPRTPVDSVLPQTLGVKDLICFTESGKGCVQEPRKSNPYALQWRKLRPREADLRAQGHTAAGRQVDQGWSQALRLPCASSSARPPCIFPAAQWVLGLVSSITCPCKEFYFGEGQENVG